LPTQVEHNGEAWSSEIERKPLSLSAPYLFPIFSSNQKNKIMSSIINPNARSQVKRVFVFNAHNGGKIAVKEEAIDGIKQVLIEGIIPERDSVSGQVKKEYINNDICEVCISGVWVTVITNFDNLERALFRG
jgi:hypothetical protein